MFEDKLPETIPLPNDPTLIGKLKRALRKVGLVLVGLVMAGLAISISYVYLTRDEKKGFDASFEFESKAIELETVPSENEQKEVIGFLPSWTVAQEQKIELDSLTQIVYFGLGVNDNGNLVKYNTEGGHVLEWVYLNSDYFKNVRQNAHAKEIKVLVALKNFDNGSIDRLVSNQYATTNFINQVIKLIDEFNLDGVNIDFEYVTDTDFPTVKYFNRFIEEVNDELKKKDPNLILSIDVNATAVMVDGAYDMVKIGETCDQVILMAYDYHRASSTRAGPVSPIWAEENEHSIDNSVRSLVGRVPKEKLILGIPFYGYEWQTISKNYKSPTINNSGAIATYKRVKELVQARGDVIINWDEKAQSPWLVYDQSGAIKQIYFENESSLAAKLNYVSINKLAGIALWALGYEDSASEIWDVIGEYTRK